MTAHSSGACYYILVCRWDINLNKFLFFIHFKPFVDEEQGIHHYFPDRFYAIALPLLAGVIGLALMGKNLTSVTLSA